MIAIGRIARQVGGIALKGLIIRRPWIDLILSGQKTWEMRSKATAMRGAIALIEKGTGTVVGVAILADSRPPLRPSDMPAHFEKHRVPQDLVEEPGFNWLTPWVITNARRLDRPVPYRHKMGAVTWVALEPEEEAAVLGAGRTGSFPIARPADEDAAVTRGHVAMVQRMLRDVSQGPANVRIPADASTSVTRRGNKLYIDVEWDDGMPERPKGRLGEAFELIGILAACVTMICMLGFLIHFVLGMGSSSISALSAFRWWIPLIVSMIVAVFLGQSHLLDDAFGKK